MSRTPTATLFFLAAFTSVSTHAFAGDIVSAGHVEIDAMLYTASSGVSWHELAVRLDIVDEGNGQEVQFPDSFCAKYGFPMSASNKCLRDPMSPDGLVISMSCVNEADNGVQSVITPVAESYRIANRPCDQRINQQDSGTLAFGDTCMHPNVSISSLGTTLTYFHEEAQSNQWKVPQLTGEHTFSCRWSASGAAPVVINPKIIFYVQNWEPDTMRNSDGEDHGWITEGGRDFGQIEAGDGDSHEFEFRNIGWNPLQLDKATGVAITGPSNSMNVLVPQLQQQQRPYSKHNLHSEPPNNIIGRGGRLGFSANVSSQNEGPKEHFTITVAPSNTGSSFFNPLVHLWFTPVSQCTPEIVLGNFGSEWVGLVGSQQTAMLSAKLFNRGCADLSVADASIDGPDASHFTIADVFVDGSSIGATSSFQIPAKGSSVVKVQFTSPGAPYTELKSYIADLVVQSDSIDVGAPMTGFDPTSVGGVSAVKLEAWTSP